MANVGDLFVRLMGNSSNFQDAMSDAEDRANAFSKSFAGNVGTAMKDVGKKMTATGLGIIASIGGIVMAGADWSAQVEGQKFLYNNLDKEVQKSIDKNSQNAKSIGLTSQQYKNGATDMSTYFTNMGLTADKTVELSGKTMDLVADLGAVKDVPFDEALGDFKSALMGNYEAVDKYGVSLSASTLENSDFVKSLGKSWNQLTDNEKMMATYNEITRQGASAQGLAKQESEGFGMKMKYLKQQISETVGQIGENLLPTLEPLIKSFSDTVKKISEWVKENPELTKTILLVVGGLGVFLTVAGPLVMLIGGIILAVGAFNVAMLPVYGIVLGVVLVIGLLVAAGIALWQNWDTIKAKIEELKGKLIAKWEEIKTQVIQKVNELKEKSVQYIKDKINSIKQTMSELPGKIREAWENAKQSMINKATEMVNSARQKITEKINAIKQTATGIKTGISDAWNNAMSYLKGINLFSIGANIIKGMVNGVKSMATSLVNSVKGVVDGAINGAKKLLGINSPSRVFMEFGKFTGEGLAIGIDKEGKNVANASKGLASNVIGGYNANLKGIKTNSSNSAQSHIQSSENEQSAPIIINIDGRKVFEVMSPYMGRASRGW